MDIENKPAIPNSLKEQLQFFFAVSIGIFLFIIFFEPFGDIHSNGNEKLLFYAGISGIAFLFMWLFRIVLPWIFPDIPGTVIWNINSDVIIYALIWIFNSVALVFYIRYVGPLKLSFFMVFKIVLVGLAPVIALKIKDDLNSLKSLSQALLEKNKNLYKIVTHQENKNLRPVEVFTSENKSEILQLTIDELILIKSADNYVEILYKDQDKIQQKLIRNTLKNIENQLKKHSSFIRCHRAYIINKKFVQDFKRGYTGYHLKLAEYNEEIPVSRQYLISVREAITSA